LNPVAVQEAQRLAAATGEHDALLRRISELTESVAARDTFIAIAAHELRNPMTPMLGHIDLLLLAVRAGNCSPEQVERRLERIQFAMRHYLRRATILLNVSRITSSKLPLELEAFDLAALLRGMVGDFAIAARYAGIVIGVAAPDSLPVTLDRLATEQIFDNLVSNALKYGARTPVEVTAVVAGEQVRIQVRDGGGGISAGDRARVFGRFERAVGLGEGRDGFGVGLWLVGQLVKAMEGEITIGDAPGGGALFTVTLPLHVTGRQQ
jgi:two-component system, OmpR family, sensor kinase